MNRRGFIQAITAGLAFAGVAKATAPVECIPVPQGFAPGGVLLTWFDKRLGMHSAAFRPRDISTVENLVSLPDDQIPYGPDEARTHIAVWVAAPDSHYRLRGIAPLCETYGTRDHFHESDIVSSGWSR